MSLDRMRTVYYGAQAFDTMNVATLYKPGELGNVAIDVAANRRGQVVQLDSGATASNTVGVVAAGQLAYWKSKPQYIVTNDWRQANAVNAPAGGWGNAGNPSLDARNFVAGVFQVAATAGYYTIILQRTDQSAGFPVTTTSATVNAGDLLVPDSVTTTAAVINVAAGTAPTAMVVGTALGARVSATGKTPCWVNIKEQD